MKIRNDLINAKAYKIGYKFTGEIYHRFEIINNLEEAITKFEEYKNKGWQPVILPVK